MRTETDVNQLWSRATKPIPRGLADARSRGAQSAALSVAVEIKFVTHVGHNDYAVEQHHERFPRVERSEQKKARAAALPRTHLQAHAVKLTHSGINAQLAIVDTFLAVGGVGNVHAVSIQH